MTHVSSTDVRRATGAWWVLALIGLLSIAAGVIILFKPGDSLATLAVIAGIFLVLDAIMELVAAIVGALPSRGLMALMGVLTLIVGILLIRHPIEGVVAVALLLGLWLVAIGTVRLFVAFERPENRVWHALAAILEIVAGVVIVSSPGIGEAPLAAPAGLAFIVSGMGLFASGWAIHELRDEVAPPTHHPGAAPA